MKEKSLEKEGTRSWMWGAHLEFEHSEGRSRGIRVQGHPQLHCKFQASCEKWSQKRQRYKQRQTKSLRLPLRRPERNSIVRQAVRGVWTATMLCPVDTIPVLIHG